MAYGYYDDRPRYTSLMDMIDGGGAGRSGDRFEGGGLLSLLANELFRPAGYEDRLRQRKNDTGRAVATVIDELTKRRDRRNLDRVDAYNRAEADRQAAAALMDERYDDTILAPGQGGLRRRLPPTTPPTAAPLRQPATGMTYPSPTAPMPAPKKKVYDEGALIREYLYFRDEQPEDLEQWLGLVVNKYGIDGLRELQASVTPNMSYQGSQIVPTMNEATVPDMARIISTDPRFSPIFAQDYGDYLEYMNTGRYPRG